jgi:predicted  nucleic acid-binding Zn-ribbon protein
MNKYDSVNQQSMDRDIQSAFELSTRLTNTINQQHVSLKNAKQQLAHITDTVHHAKLTKQMLQECIVKVELLQNKIPPHVRLSHERMRRKYPNLSRLILGVSVPTSPRVVPS